MVEALAVRGDLEGTQAVVLVGQGHLALLVDGCWIQGCLRQVDFVHKNEPGRVIGDRV